MTMPECWLKTNARPWHMALAASLILLVAGAIVAAVGAARGWPSPAIVGGAALLGLGGICLAATFYASRIPRLAYDERELLVYLRSLTPLRVPVDVVECFFLGQGPAHPATPGAAVPKTANVIVRIAEGAPQWHTRAVRANLGQWSDGYITIRGMWCEPLSHERVNQLNRRLRAAHRAAGERQEIS